MQLTLSLSVSHRRFSTIKPTREKQITRMYVIIAPINIKEGHKDEFLKEIISDAKGSVADEPGCQRFDVIQDPEIENRIWLYEVYDDAEAFQAHLKAPHFLKCKNAVADWMVEGAVDKAIGGTPIFYTGR